MSGAIAGKVWGEDMGEVISQNGVEVRLIKVYPGGHCSQHRHLHKFNKFQVLPGSGKLDIYVERAAYDLTDRTQLHAGESMIVQPGEYHWFRAVSEPVYALESYWTELAAQDIERRTVGGRG